MEMRWRKSFDTEPNGIQVRGVEDWPSYYLVLQYREWPKNCPDGVEPVWRDVPIEPD